MSNATTGPPAVERRKPPELAIKVANPVMRTLLGSPLHRLVSRQLMLLSYTGRRSGRRIALPVARQEVDGRLAAISNSRWRHNFAGGREAELVVEGRRRPVTGTLIDDPTKVAEVYADRIARQGWKKAQNQLGIKINVGRAPTADELEDAIRRTGLALVAFEPR